MAQGLDFVDFVVDLIDEDCGVTHKMMFGGCCLYSGGKVFALICDDQLFVKPTDGGRAFIEEVVEAPPYPGAKQCFLIADRMEDSPWLSELVRITTRELPAPKPRKRKKSG
jgi:TfoX/Sxy family transcriptional regulator of competence genes